MDDERDRATVRSAVLVVTALAWALLSLPQHDHGTSEDVRAAVVNWWLMVAAMMAPILIPPIQFVRGSVLARRRLGATLLFVTGYSAVWMVVGALLLTLAAALRTSTVPPSVAIATMVVIAVLWQCSPAKQVCLNRCHARPTLAAFGPAADVGVLAFGVTHGVTCAASCWAWMVLPLLVPAGHVAAMAAAAILIFCERLDNPAPAAWRWRGLARARRFVIGRIRMRMSANVLASR